MNPKVLIVDDSIDFCTTIADIVNSEGYETIQSYSPESALTILKERYHQIALMLLDIEFAPDSRMNGLDVLLETKKNYPAIPVVIISGKGNMSIATQAGKNGAIDFVEKNDITKDKIKTILKNFVSKSHSSDKKEIIKYLKSCGIYGESDAIIKIGENIIRFGRTQLNVLITGPTGTGKGLVARAIHQVSQRSKFPFVTVDIPNIPRELFQSELFGAVKGAYTGSTENKEGLFLQANHGTIFLDEIANLSLDLQANLLIPIEEKEIKQLGSTKRISIDVRFISATDKDLSAAIKTGEFKEQLYYRLRECEIVLPPLKDRIEDIPYIVNGFIQDYNKDKIIKKHITNSAINILMNYEWPGNVRELINVVKTAFELAETDSIEPEDIIRGLNNSKNEMTSDATGSIDRRIDETYKKAIEEVLQKFNGNVSKAAAHLGISRETLYLRIKKYLLNVNQYRNKQTEKKTTD